MRLHGLMMTAALLWTLGGCAGSDSPSRSATPRLRMASATGQKTGGFAVVELFTSEGCSSCPPADKLLGQIDERARADGSRVFPLAFHVDYWNHLGWTDPFSSEASSNRQRDYGRALHLESIYTPQMIVNGEREFVGSNGEIAEKAVSEALSRPEENTITLHLGVGREYGDVLTEYDVAGERKGVDCSDRPHARRIDRRLGETFVSPQREAALFVRGMPFKKATPVPERRVCAI